MRLMKVWKDSPSLPFGEKASSHALYSLRNTFRRHRTDRQTIRSGVLAPLPADNNLEVRHGIAAFIAADGRKNRGRQYGAARTS